MWLALGQEGCGGDSMTLGALRSPRLHGLTRQQSEVSTPCLSRAVTEGVGGISSRKDSNDTGLQETRPARPARAEELEQDWVEAENQVSSRQEQWGW